VFAFRGKVNARERIEARVDYNIDSSLGPGS